MVGSFSSYRYGFLFVDADGYCPGHLLDFSVDVVEGKVLVGEDVVGEFLLDFPLHLGVGRFFALVGEGHVHVGGHHHETEIAVLDFGEDESARFGVALVELGTEIA